MTGSGRHDGHDEELTRTTWRAIGQLAAVAVGTVAVLSFALSRLLHLIPGLPGVRRWWLWGLAGLALLIVLMLVRRRAVRRAMHDAARRLEPLPTDHPATVMLQRLSTQADVPMPRLGVCEGAPNAYVLADPDGRPVIALTDGLLEACQGEQLEAVLAHELFHVAHGDAGVVAVLEGLGGATRSDAAATRADAGRPERLAAAAARAGLVTLDLSSWRVIGGIQGWLLHAVRAVLRQRELAADLAAAELTGQATALTEAIVRCSGSGSLTPGADLRVVASVGFVAESDRAEGRDATHPAASERAAVLARVATRMGAR